MFFYWLLKLGHGLGLIKNDEHTHEDNMTKCVWVHVYVCSWITFFSMSSSCSRVNLDG